MNMEPDILLRIGVALLAAGLALSLIAISIELTQSSSP
jgi:hypothetical protein